MSGDKDVSGQETRARTTGRPAYKPSDEQRATVRRMVGEQATKAAIATAIGISRNTLRKAFKDDLVLKEVPSANPQLDFGGEAHKVATVVAEPGRPEFEPTDRQKADVCLWAADGWTEARMARQLDISRTTLRKHFEAELEFGADKIRTQVLRDLARGSAAGKTAASAKLLERTSLLVPKDPPPIDDTPEALGKKAEARRDAQTAEVGTSWEHLTTQH